MERNPIVTVDNVSMKFNLSSEKFDSFKEYVIKSIKRQVSYDAFMALQGVSFEVMRGDSVGLVGLNGSGKSTMLKVIAGVLKPTEGKVAVNGTIAPLIELGAGFDMDLTARENVFLNGALLDITVRGWKSSIRILWNFQNWRSLWMFRSRIFLREWFPDLRLRSQRSVRRTS